MNDMNNSTSLLGALLGKPVAPVSQSSSHNQPWLSCHHHLSTPIDPDLLATLNSNSNIDFPNSKPVRASVKRDLNWKLVKEGDHGDVETHSATVVSEDGRAACLHTNCSSCFETEAIRVDTPIRTNCVTTFEWHVAAHVTSGTSVMFGLCDPSLTRLHSSGYVDLLGADEFSLALSSKGRLHFAGYSLPYCQPFDDGRAHTITCVVNTMSNLDADYIEFRVDGKSMGRAFEGLVTRLGPRMYACVSSTSARSIVRLGRVFEVYPSLQEMCTYSIHADQTGSLLNRALNEYHLPKSILS